MYMKKLITVLMLLMAMTASAQQFELRLLNHWDNPDGTVERGYAGSSIWRWDEIPVGKKAKMPAYLVEKYNEYGRLNQEFGINGTVLNNVNAKPAMMSSDMLRKTAKIADILRPYGIRVYLSVNFASPKALGDLDTADPLDKRVGEWWKKKADEIYKLIPDFGGFLVKANSEGEPGPMDYGRTHVDGANMLAAALKPHGGIVMWRAFVYAAAGPSDDPRVVHDRANQAYDEFVRFDGQFSDNVIIQIKNGPIDFQPREAVSPLFFALKKTRMMAEFQITQEYTGHSIQTCYLAPMWREFLDVIQEHNVKLEGLAGVANIGDAGMIAQTKKKTETKSSGTESWKCAEWTANELAMSNWYAFGRLSNDAKASSYDIACDFLGKFYTHNEKFVDPMTQLLMKSRETMVNYMMPLGLHHIFAGGHHYGPEPWCAPQGWREDWLPRYYHKADEIGIGFNRTDHAELQVSAKSGKPEMLPGSANVNQYPEPLRTMYNNLSTCPENLLLWFHHVSWKHTMSNGLSLWDNLCYKYDEGLRQAREFVTTWESVRPYVEPARWEAQNERFVRQAQDAQWWHDACLQYFHEFSKMPYPADMMPFVYDYKALREYKLDIDNYSVASPEMLP